MTGLSTRVARSFTRGQQSYHAQAIVQKQIANSLVNRLIKQAGHCTFPRSLEAGYGSGHLTHALTALKIERLWLNDLVAPPLSFQTDARYLNGNIKTAPLPDQLDLIISASMIQWIEDPQRLINRLCAQAVPQGWLALSGFAPHHFCELQQLGSPAAAPALMTAETMATLLPQGWDVKDLGAHEYILWFDTALEILHHLRATGVNACASQRWTRQHLAEFCSTYTLRFGYNGKVPLTYAPAWLVAQKR